MKDKIKKVIIVGRDAEAWLVALALHHRYGKQGSGVEVELIELPPDVGESDAYITSPMHKALHDLLRLDEDILIKSSAGVASYGQRFSNWCGPMPAFMHAYDRHGYDFDNVDFIHYWLRAKQAGLDVPLEDFSFGAVAAKNNRYVVFNDKTGNFSTSTYGYNFHAISYVKSIARAALSIGLKHSRDVVSSVETYDGQIVKLNLLSGKTASADFYVDASGAEARLMRELEDKDNISGNNAWFPCDRKVVASAKPMKPMPAFSQISAFKEGWFGVYPLVGKTTLTAMYSSELEDLDKLLHKISSLSGMQLQNVEMSLHKVGVRKKSWIGNCCAVGGSSACLEQLDAADLHLAHVGISYLCSLFPISNAYEAERNIYNSKVVEHAESVRDYQLAHYALNQRKGERLWDAVRSEDLPASLAKKITLFKSAGKVSMNEVELFQEENWRSLFVGHNLIPDSYDPRVNKMPEAEQIDKFQNMLNYISSEVQQLPTMQTEHEMNTASDGGSFF